MPKTDERIPDIDAIAEERFIFQEQEDEMTTCKDDNSLKAFNCQREEQGDDCWLVDHLRECSVCTHVDHPVKELSEGIY